MTSFRGLLAVIALAFGVTACGHDDGESFLGQWEGINSRNTHFNYTIERNDDVFTIERQMKTYTPDIYKAKIADSHTLKLEDGDELRYDKKSDTVYAVTDDVTLSRIE